MYIVAKNQKQAESDNVQAVVSTLEEAKKIAGIQNMKVYEVMDNGEIRYNS